MKRKNILRKLGLGGYDTKIIVKDPAEIEREKKRIDKRTAMQIALTYIEGQNMVDVSPKKATEIADEFLAWLEK